MGRDRDERQLVRRIDTQLDRYAESVGYARVELLLQQRAQDMRELADADDDPYPIRADDLDGWSEG